MGVEKKKKGAMCTMVCAGSVTLSIRLDSAYQRPELFFFKRVSLALSTVQWVPCTIYRTHQTSFFNKTFIKNRSYSITHTFKNYFVIVFSVFSKIIDIQTHPKGKKKNWTNEPSMMHLDRVS